jgi:hypothetical protein
MNNREQLEKAVEMAVESLKLIAAQDQALAGDVSEAYAWREARNIALRSIYPLQDALKTAKSAPKGNLRKAAEEMLNDIDENRAAVRVSVAEALRNAVNTPDEDQVETAQVDRTMTNHITIDRQHIDYAAQALEYFLKDYNGPKSFNILVSEIIDHLYSALAADEEDKT